MQLRVMISQMLSVVRSLGEKSTPLLEERIEIEGQQAGNHETTSHDTVNSNFNSTTLMRTIRHPFVNSTTIKFNRNKHSFEGGRECVREI